MKSWNSEDQYEHPWERERRLQREKEDRAREQAEQLRERTRTGVLTSLQAMSRDRITTINLRSREHRRRLGKCDGDILADLKWDTPAAKVVAETLCWLRQHDMIGIIGFTGDNANKFLKFCSRNKARLDIRIFPKIAELAV